MKKRFVLVFIFSISITTVFAQNMTNSPASMYGLGELSTGEGGLYAGMGGAGIALRGENFLNSANPASLTELKPEYFTVDFGVKGSYQNYKQSGANNHSVTGNLNNFGIGTRLTPRWYASFFLAPVSSVGYVITKEGDVAGGDNQTNTSYFEGSGGLSKIGISTAYKLWKGLSIGANFSYIAGTIEQTEINGSATDKNSSFKYAVYADFGLQYKWNVDRDRYFVAGLVYGHSQDFIQDNDHTVSSSSSSETIDERGKKNHTCLPQFVGGGLSYNTLRFNITADYKYVDWSRMESSQSNVSFRNQHDFRIGGGYVVGNPYRNPTKLLLGAGISNSYLSIQKQKPTNYYVSMGVNCDIMNRCTVSLGAKYNNQFKVNPGRFKEQSLSLFLNLTFSEKVYRAKLR